MDIYLACTVLTLFIIFGIIPVLASESLGTGCSYLECLAAGLMGLLVIVVFFALFGAVLWSALFVMNY